MIYTALCLAGFLFCSFAVWWQGRKHWGKAILNTILAVLFGYSACMRITTGNHSTYIPEVSMPSIVLTEISWFEWSGIILLTGIFLVGVVNLYRCLAERG